ncbi:hypothetical protein SAMN04487926_11882 [Paraburkholderia steynii]|uniref:Uncharacterized protein n=1 Tax=Paraburkholderia steynii TaxID=1245441 RepID=A0A7Z7BC90_9BURK|nr:hypothetical protein SAMN04487926_11882 [Paraburkholderia steynii]
MHPCDAVETRLHHTKPCVVGTLTWWDDGPPDARIANQCIDTPIVLQRLIDQRCDSAALGYVAGNAGRHFLRPPKKAHCRPGTCLIIQSRYGNSGAVSRQPMSAGQTQVACRASDRYHISGQPRRFASQLFKQVFFPNDPAPSRHCGSIVGQRAHNQRIDSAIVLETGLDCATVDQRRLTPKQPLDRFLGGIVDRR